MRDKDRRGYRPSRYQLRYLLYYGLIFLIPLTIVGSVVYKNTVVALNQEVKELHMNKLSALQMTLDGDMAGLRDLAERIASDPLLTRFGLRDSVSGEPVKQLKLYLSSNPFCEEIYLRYHGDPLVYSAQGTAYPEVVAKELYPGGGTEREAFLTALGDGEQTLPFQMSAPPDGGRPGNLLHFIPIPQTASFSNGLVFFSISGAGLDSILSDSLGVLSGAAYVLDGRGEVVVRTSRDSETALDGADLAFLAGQADGVYSIRLGERNYSAAARSSDLLNWRYVVVMPEEQFFTKSLQMQSTLFTVILIALAVGVLLAFTVWLRTYSPLRRLIRHIMALSPKEAGAPRHELQLVQDVFDRLLLENRDLNSAIAKCRPMLQDSMLRRLLRGGFPGGQPGLLETAYLRFPYPYFFSLVISIRGRFEGDMDRNEEFIQSLMNIRTADFVVYGVDLIGEDSIALLVDLDCPEEELPRRQERFAAELSGLFQRFGRLYPVIGVGAAVNTLSEVGRSFIEARAAVQFGRSGQEKQVVCFREIAGLNHWDEWYPSENLLLLRESLEQGNAEVAIESVRGILEQIQRSSHSLLGARCIFMDLVKIVSEAANRSGLCSLQKRLDQMAAQPNPADSLSALEDCVREVCRFLRERDGGAQAQIRDRLLAYISSHYKNDSFCLEDVARHFYISIYYLSRFFKEQTGVNFSDYVASLRINEAKRLLRETDRKVKEVTEEVGYRDPSNFIRRFREQAGMTPSQYRALSRKSDGAG